MFSIEIFKALEVHAWMLLFLFFIFFIKTTMVDETEYSVFESKGRDLVHSGIMKTEKQLFYCNQDLSYK